MDRPDSPFRLTEAERAALRPSVNVTTLERLLARIPVEERKTVLAMFGRGWPGLSIPSGGPGAVTGDARILGVEFEDPDLQRLFGDVLNQVEQGPSFDFYRRVELPAREAPVLLVAPGVWAHGDAVAVLARRTEPAPQDLVLVHPPRIDAAGLYSALEELVAERIRSGVVASQTLTRPCVPGAYPLPASEPLLWRLAESLRQLLGASETMIDGEGQCRTWEFRIVF